MSVVLDQTITFEHNRILPVMTPTTLPVVLRRLRYDQRHLYRVS